MAISIKWQNDLEIYSSLYSTLIISGNIHDVYLYDDAGMENIADNLSSYLEYFFCAK